MAEGRSAGRWAPAPCDRRLPARWGYFALPIEHFPASCAGRVVRERGAITPQGEKYPCPIRRRWCATTARRGGDYVRPTLSSLAAQEMRVGPSDSDCRIRVQTTASCSGTTAGVVSVAGKGGSKSVRCLLVSRTQVNR